MNNLDAGAGDVDVVRVQSVLQVEEQVVLLARPRAGMPVGQAALLVLPGVLVAWAIVYGAVMLREDCWVLLLFGLPFLLMAAVVLMSPLWHRRCTARTLYVLTNRRVLIFAPEGLRRERVVSMPLGADLVRKVQKCGGYGDIIFAWERRWQPGARVYSPVQPVGFLAVPQPERVEQMIAEQVAALQADIELPPVEGVQPLTVNGKGRVRAFSGVEGLLMWGGVVCCALSFLFLMWGVHSLQREIPFGRNSVKTYATVKSLRKEVSMWNSPRSEREKVRSGRYAGRYQFASYYPTVQFVDESGAAHTAEISTAQKRRHFRPGNKVMVSYNRLNPEQVVPGKARVNGMGFCLGSCMLFLIGFCIAVVLMKKRIA